MSASAFLVAPTANFVEKNIISAHCSFGCVRVGGEAANAEIGKRLNVENGNSESSNGGAWFKGVTVCLGRTR